MKFLRLLVPLLGITLLAYFGYNKLKSNKEIIDENSNQTETVVSHIPVNTSLVSTHIMDNSLDLIGTFKARKELNVIAESQGRITTIYVKEGQRIGKGQSIASIDDATIQAQIATAKASLEKSSKDVERYKNLLSVGAISQTQYEEVRLNMQNQQTNLTVLEQQSKYSTAKSPMTGVVKEILLEEGSFASPGLPIASIVDISKLHLVVNVSEADIVKVKQNQKVQIHTEVYPDKVFTGTVYQISVQADEARNYEIAIEIVNNNTTPLKAGMYGTVKIPTSEVNQPKEVLVVPRKSVIGSLKQPQVFVAKDGKSILKNIEVGNTIDEMVVVKAGLVQGEEVIVSGQINLEDGREIRIVSNNSSLSENK